LVTTDSEARPDLHEQDRFFGNTLPVELGVRRATEIYTYRLLTVACAGALILAIATLGALVGLAPVLVAWILLLIILTAWALRLDMIPGSGGRATRWRARFFFPAMFVLFTSTAVLTASLAVADPGAERPVLIGVCLAATACVFLLGKLTLIRAEVAAARSAADKHKSADVLVRLTVGIAQAVCGRNLSRRAITRGIFYQLEENDRVVLRAHEGSYGDQKPRPLFDGRNSLNERRVVELAKGERVLVVNDIDAAPPEYFSDYRGRPYKSYIAVPVRAGDRPLGVLMIDSDTPNALTDVDVGYAILLAGILGTGLAIADTASLETPTFPDVSLIDEMAKTLDVVFAQELPRTAVSFSLSPDMDRRFLTTLRQHPSAPDQETLEEYRRTIVEQAQARAERGLRHMNSMTSILIWAESTAPVFGGLAPESKAAR
jgi:hypothetical protein